MATTPVEMLGQEAIKTKGWLRAYKWLLLRRTSQLSILMLFLLGPLFGVWIVKGNMISSLTLETLPLTDPFVLLQSFLAGHALEATAVIGALIVLVFYTLVGGRVYCSWVCPVNIITDTAEWLRRKLGLSVGRKFSNQTRYWILGLSLLLALLTNMLVWELVSPVSIINRGLVFGMGFSWIMALTIFIFDAFISSRAWCGHLCPVGAFYSVLGNVSLLRVNAVARNHCDDCMECYAVCPEPKVIIPVLKERNSEKDTGSIVMSSNCTNCGRCIDICGKEVFSFDHRFNNHINQFKQLKTSHQREILS
jgi:ferredoxin-type protein NapH